MEDAPTDAQSLSSSPSQTLSRSHAARNWFIVLGMVYMLLVAVGVIGDGFRRATGGQAGAEELFRFATNPFLGVILGTLATALIQSSSTVTSVIVGLVAGGLPVSVAIPMVMGANLGTTITNTLVSLGHVRDKDEFRRAFAAATVHDWFNLLAIAIFLPLEIGFGMLEKLSGALAGMLAGSGSMSTKGFDILGSAVKPARSAIGAMTTSLSDRAGGIVLAVIGVVLIFAAITFLGRALKSVMVGSARRILHAAIGRGPLSGILSGTAVTVLVQSSSTTTSLMVPLAGSGIFSLKEIYPFTLGANIGTTITALLAATAVTGGNQALAIQIAIAHFLFNLMGVSLIYGIPALRDIPIRCANAMANIGAERKGLALAYVFGLFFVLPGLLAFVGSTFIWS